MLISMIFILLRTCRAGLSSFLETSTDGGKNLDSYRVGFKFWLLH